MRATRTLAVAAVLTAGATAQTAWGPRPSGFAPPARGYFGMACDPVRHRTVVFGGAGPAVLPNDTWEWDGARWTQHVATPAPNATRSGAMAFDFRGGRALWFGGYMPNGTHSDETWAWDGLVWQLLQPGNRPSARSGHAMAPDTDRDRLVLFGGLDAGTVRLADTWEWDGQDWHLRLPAHAPSARTDHVMAYDARRGVTVLYGGLDAALNVVGDTWEWDGVDWTRRTPPAAPGPRLRAAMAFDPRRARTVLHGGMHNQVFGDTWEWDGGQWLRRTPGSSPSPRAEHGLVFDPDVGAVVLFGGYDGLNHVNDVWEYHSLTPTAFEPFGHGCPGAAGVPDLGRAEWTGAWLGESLTFVLEPIPPAPAVVPFLLLGTSNERLGGQSLPFPLDPIGMTGCLLWIAPDLLTAPMPKTGPVAEFDVPVPNDLRLVGVPFFGQAFVVDPGANPLGVIASNGAIAVIGAK